MLKRIILLLVFLFLQNESADIQSMNINGQFLSYTTKITPTLALKISSTCFAGMNFLNCKAEPINDDTLYLDQLPIYKSYISTSGSSYCLSCCSSNPFQIDEWDMSCRLPSTLSAVNADAYGLVLYMARARFIGDTSVISCPLKRTGCEYDSKGNTIRCVKEDLLSSPNRTYLIGYEIHLRIAKRDQDFQFWRGVESCEIIPIESNQSLISQQYFTEKMIMKFNPVTQSMSTSKYALFSLSSFFFIYILLYFYRSKNCECCQKKLVFSRRLCYLCTFWGAEPADPILLEALEEKGLILQGELPELMPGARTFRETSQKLSRNINSLIKKCGFFMKSFCFFCFSWMSFGFTCCFRMNYYYSHCQKKNNQNNQNNNKNYNNNMNHNNNSNIPKGSYLLNICCSYCSCFSYCFSNRQDAKIVPTISIESSTSTSSLFPSTLQLPPTNNPQQIETTTTTTKTIKEKEIETERNQVKTKTKTEIRREEEGKQQQEEEKGGYNNRRRNRKEDDDSFVDLESHLSEQSPLEINSINKQQSPLARSPQQPQVQSQMNHSFPLQSHLSSPFFPLPSSTQQQQQQLSQTQKISKSSSFFSLPSSPLSKKISKKSNRNSHFSSPNSKHSLVSYPVRIIYAGVNHPYQKFIENKIFSSQSSIQLQAKRAIRRRFGFNLNQKDDDENVDDDADDDDNDMRGGNGIKFSQEMNKKKSQKIDDDVVGGGGGGRKEVGEDEEDDGDGEYFNDEILEREEEEELKKQNQNNLSFLQELKEEAEDEELQREKHLKVGKLLYSKNEREKQRKQRIAIRKKFQFERKEKKKNRK